MHRKITVVDIDTDIDIDTCKSIVCVQVLFGVWDLGVRVSRLETVFTTRKQRFLKRV